MKRGNGNTRFMVPKWWIHDPDDDYASPLQEIAEICSLYINPRVFKQFNHSRPCRILGRPNAWMVCHDFVLSQPDSTDAQGVQGIPLSSVLAPLHAHQVVSTTPRECRAISSAFDVLKSRNSNQNEIQIQIIEGESAECCEVRRIPTPHISPCSCSTLFSRCISIEKNPATSCVKLIPCKHAPSWEHIPLNPSALKRTKSLPRSVLEKKSPTPESKKHGADPVVCRHSRH